MYLFVMAIRPEALPTDAAALTEMVLALDAENEKLPACPIRVEKLQISRGK
jgi:hypothetical protein